MTAASGQRGLALRVAEVLGLLARGLTNNAIAAARVVTPGTVERHLVHIYTKIGVRRRAEATAYAIRHGLAAHSPQPPV